MRDVLRNLVITLCLLGAGGFATWLWLRPELPRASEFSDGSERVSPRGLRDRLRTVLWRDPELLDGVPRNAEIETEAFADDSTGQLYFTVGAPEHDQDLYRLLPRPDGPPDVEPITALNTAADESGAWVHDGFLYFSSNRDGGFGGRDLWRARITERGFGPPENLGEGVNTDADETDPCFRPHSSELYFASNHDAVVGIDDFDLRFSRTDGRFFSDSSPLQQLSTPYDERWPTFAADGNGLVFASDRPGTGGFDLYRAFFDVTDFFHAEAIAPLNSEADEWAPRLSDGGYRLTFSSDRASSGDHDLFQALSQELYPLPGRGLSLTDLIILFFLLLLALLAWLGRRWHALDVLYKCLLLSLLLHLLFLWLSKRVDIEVAPEPLEEGAQIYEVHLAQLLEEVSTLENRERADAVEAPARTESSTEVAREQMQLQAAATVARAAEPLDSRADSATAASPSRRAGRHSPSQSSNEPSVDVQNPSESFERYQGAAAAVAVETSSAEASRAAVESAPDRSAPSLEQSASESRARESAVALERSATATPTASPARTRRIESRTPSIEVGPRMAIAGPSDRVNVERTESAVAQVRAPSLESAVAESAQPRAASPVRSSATEQWSDSEPSTSARGEAPLALAERGAPSAQEIGRSERTHTPSQHQRPELGVAVLTPADRATIADAGSASALASESLDGTPTDANLERSSAADAPARSEVALGDAAPAAAQAPSRDVAALGRRGERMPTPAPIRRGASTHTPRSPLVSGPQLANPSAERASASPPTSAEETLADAGEAESFLERLEGASSDAPAVSRASVTMGEVQERVAREANAPLARGTTTRVPRSLERRHRTSLDPLRATGASAPELRAPRAETSTTAQANPSRGSASGRSGSSSLALGPSRLPLQRGSAATATPSRAPTRLAADFGELGPAAFAPLARSVESPARARQRPERSDASAPARVAQFFERREGPAKEQALREGGGGAETERAVLAGLRYLASVQRRNGSFGDRNDRTDREKYGDVRIGKTGLALLAFLGANHTHRSGSEFSEHVAAAMTWLLEQQDRRSGHFGNCDGYGHGIATYALVECYALTQDRTLLTPLIRALRHVEDMQVDDMAQRSWNGGWRYYDQNGQREDPYPRASLSSWQAMALESAKMANLPVTDESLEAARSYFLGTFDRRFGYFRYNHNPDWLNNPSGYRTLPASTPAAMFVLSLLGADEHPSLDSGAEYVMERIPRGWFYRSDDAFAREGVGNLYFWYYGTLAMFLRGGADWRRWNEAMKRTLLEGQRRDGSWDPISVYAREYAGDDAGERTYSTALCVLTLEVYYRYFTPQLARHRRTEEPR